MIEAVTPYEIIQRLRAVEKQHNVSILYACESGSRAWGFASPDSDYDVRFFYVHKVCDYVGLKTMRDVIELPIDGLLDINGWDLRKALALAINGNAIVSEWLKSPVQYIRTSHADTMEEMVDKHADLSRYCSHYAGLAMSSYCGEVRNKEQVKLKKYLYAMRACLCIQWIRERNTAPPINVDQLIGQLSIDSEMQIKLNELIDAKSKTGELGVGDHIPMFDQFIEETIGTNICNAGHAQRSKDFMQEANDFMFSVIGLR